MPISMGINTELCVFFIFTGKCINSRMLQAPGYVTLVFGDFCARERERKREGERERERESYRYIDT